MDGENRTEAIRHLSLAKMEEHYAKRMEELVNDMQLASAEASFKSSTRINILSA